MYITFRKYKIDPKNTDTIVRKVNEGFLPIISRAIGYVSYTVFLDGEGRICSVSNFTTRAGLEEANLMAREWVADNIAEYLPNPPEVSEGESLIFKRLPRLI